MPKLYKKLIDIIALLCLAAVFLFTFKKLVDGRNRREEAGTKYLEREKNRNLVYDKE